MPRLPALLSVLFLWTCLVGMAAAAQRLMAETAVVSLATEAAVYEDKSGRMSLDDVQRIGSEFRRWNLQRGEALNFGYSSSAWWLRVDLVADEKVRRDWLLEVAFPTLDSIEFFGPGETRLSTGDRRNFGTRPIPHRNFAFPVNLPESGAGTVWLRVSSQGTLTVPLALWRPDAFWPEAMNGYVVHSAYFGMLLALALYNLLLWFSLREPVYLHYVMFVTGMAVGQLSLSGFGNQFLWPSWPAWGNRAFVIGFSLAGLFGALFVRSFLATRSHQPRVDGAIVGLAGLFAVCMLAPLVAPYRLMAILTSLAGVAFSAVAVLSGLRAWRAGQSGAGIFLAAWMVLLLGAAAFGLRNMNLLPTNVFSIHALQAGSAIEMLLLSFALGDRINGLRRENDIARGEALAARQDIAAALKRSEAGFERRVRERTSELETMNARLRENERQLQALAHADPLTGLANRLLFGARLEQSIQLARRSRGQIALLLVDLDRFGAINGTYGRAIGDEVLRLAALRLRDAVRAVDTVARLGDDEFAVVLSGLTGIADAEGVADKIVNTLREPMRVLGMPLEISASAGVAMYSGGDLSPPELMRRANQSMHDAKQAGRDRYRVYSA